MAVAARRLVLLLVFAASAIALGPEIKPGDFSLSDRPTVTTTHPYKPATVRTPVAEVSLDIAASGRHWTVPVRVDDTTVNLIVDTGHSNVVVFNQTYCDAAPLVPHPNCVAMPAVETDSVENWAIVVDGIMATIRGRTANAPMDLPLDSPAVNQTAAVDAMPFLSGFAESGQYFAGVDGSIGLGYKALSTVVDMEPVPAPFAMMLQRAQLSAQETAKRLFALSFRQPPEQSSLHLGGYLRANDLTWSDPSIEVDPFFIRSRIYHMGLCGVSLFANHSSSWSMMLDTGGACLTLPAEFFDAIANHVDLVCTPDPSGLSGRACYLEDGVAANTLPVLQFSMCEACTPLYVPLESLVIPAAPTAPHGRELCLRRGESWFQTRVFSADSDIVFGSLVLQSLYAVIDLDARRVAFAQQPLGYQPPAEQRTTMCQALVTCPGASQPYPPLNDCLPPRCDHYYFLTTDSESMTCVYHQSFLIVVPAMGIVVVLFYAVVVEAHTRLNRVVTHFIRSH